MHQDDGLKGGAASVGQLMERLLSAPVLLQQGVAHHAGRPFEVRAEAKGNIRGRLSAAAVRQVHLEPKERSHDRDGSAKKWVKWAAQNVEYDLLSLSLKLEVYEIKT